jgi:hypothetical protein
MAVGTTASPWRYDSTAAETIRLGNQRPTTILRYASWAAVFPISLVVRLPIDSGPFDQSTDRRDGPEGVGAVKGMRGGDIQQNALPRLRLSARACADS